MAFHDLTNSAEIDDARHKIDRALLDGAPDALAEWAREFGRPAVEALRSLHDQKDPSNWDYD